MDMRTLFAPLLMLIVALPLYASAQTGDVILDLLSALEAPIPVATTTKPAATHMPAAVSSVSATTSIQSAVGLPILYSIDGKVPTTAEESSLIEKLKALVAQLTAQLAALIAAQADVSQATSTPASVEETGVFRRVLDIGSKGDDVTRLQEILIARELFFHKATGYFGKITKEAVRALQAENELEPTGTTGPETRVLLNELALDPKKGMQTYTVPTLPEPVIEIASMPATTTVATSTETSVPAAPALDTEPPTPPTNAGAGPASNSQMSLAWSASTDNVGVVLYTISRDIWPIATTTMRSYLDIGLPASTTYQYFIRAVDAAGNISAPAMTSGTTLP